MEKIRKSFKKVLTLPYGGSIIIYRKGVNKVSRVERKKAKKEKATKKLIMIALYIGNIISFINSVFDLIENLKKHF
ncbi:hypothetical protein [Paraclostridium sordellii]|uniref:hypothetical protein n=1 Tax=Paraclostridium sordellii TaxID=1505 RepID=UPI000710F077|nr:hypothetical protein [Paeniclostridium sordellii]AUN12776.1 hypothetical protein RSJ16_00095 [Paeniclostridium sordellii]